MIMRTSYSLLDVLADIGGVTATLVYIVSMTVMLFIFNYEKYVFSTLIYSRKELQDECIKQGWWSYESK